MNKLLLILWRLIKGPLQWRALWLAHSKFVVGVTSVVLNNKKEVLLLRHTYWPAGSWGLPSGYANSNEKLEDTVVRELYEETRLNVKVDSLIRVISGYKLRLEVYYLSHITGGNLKLDTNEILEAKFFSVKDLPKGLLGNHREILEEVFSKQN